VDDVQKATEPCDVRHDVRLPGPGHVYDVELPAAGGHFGRASGQFGRANPLTCAGHVDDVQTGTDPVDCRHDVHLVGPGRVHDALERPTWSEPVAESLGLSPVRVHDELET
jgi:hypothetical protein